MDSSNSSAWAYQLNIQPESMGYPEIDNTFYFLRPIDFYLHEAITKADKRPRNISSGSQFIFSFNWLLWSLRVCFLRTHPPVLK
jgi:hypothetical protein